jgi:hypothetical protein
MDSTVLKLLLCGIAQRLIVRRDLPGFHQRGTAAATRDARSASCCG